MGPPVHLGQGYRWPTDLRITAGPLAKREFTGDVDAHRTC
jgi:hypothetical protein